MPEETTTEVTETGTEETTQSRDELPADHPLVKTLAVQKTAIKELRAKEKRLNEIEESQKSETEKAADRVAKAEAEVASVPSKVADALRTHLVELHSIDAEDAELFLTATEPELLLKQVTRLIDQSGKRHSIIRAPKEGTTVTKPAETDAAFAAQLFGNG